MRSQTNKGSNKIPIFFCQEAQPQLPWPIFSCRIGWRTQTYLYSQSFSVAEKEKQKELSRLPFVATYELIVDTGFQNVGHTKSGQGRSQVRHC